MLEATTKHLQMSASEPGGKMADWNALEATSKHVQVAVLESREGMANMTCG